MSVPLVQFKKGERERKKKKILWILLDEIWSLIGFRGLSWT